LRRPFASGPIAVGLLAVTCAQACATHSGPTARGARGSPVAKSVSVTIEGTDPALSAALLVLRLAPTAAAHRAVAAEYRRLRIDDTAFDHLRAATRLDPSDAAAYDGLARIWRDWGYAALGLPDAARAVFYAPGSAAAHNTRGTLLAAIGDRAGAKRDFERALALDPTVTYAATNLCRLEGVSASTDQDGPCRQIAADNASKGTRK
jgi:tetratricopeptide (TPR) repeat protein